MTGKLNFQEVSKDILSLLHHHGLEPDTLNINIVVSRSAFERLAVNHSDAAQSDIILVMAETDGLQWSLQILPRRTLKDFPPGIILTPPK